MLNELKVRTFRSNVAEILLRKILDEKQEIPTFFVIDKICSKIKIKTLSIKKIIDELDSRGIENSTTHFHKTGLRAKAKIPEIEAIFKKLSNGKNSKKMDPLDKKIKMV